MKLSELLEDIEELEKRIKQPSSKFDNSYESREYTISSPNLKEYKISFNDRREVKIPRFAVPSPIGSIKSGIDILAQLGFVDDLQDSPQELMKSAIDRIIKQRQEEGATLLPKEFKADQKEEAKKHDAVNHPSHYTQGEVECIDAIASACINKQGIEAVCAANIIKYLWRYESKNGIEDVKKAQWYLQKLIKELEKQQKE